MRSIEQLRTYKNLHHSILDADFYFYQLNKEDQEHALRVMNFSMKIALQMNVCKDIDILKRAAKYHDLGKLKIPYEILNKSGVLNFDERKAIMIHAKYSGEMLCSVGEDRRVIEIAMLHHENFDGTGYPFKMKGKDIPLEARIIRVADVFDALRSERSYKNIFPIDVCKDIMLREKDHYDPEVLKALMSII